MCYFKSFIATKDKLYHVNGLNSHEDIVSYHGLPDRMDRDGRVQIVRMELLPPEVSTDNIDNILDPEWWTFRTDQDLLPDWYVPEEWHEKCKLWVANAPVLTGRKAIVDSWYLLAKDADIHAMVNGGEVHYFCGGMLKNFRGGTLNDFWGGMINSFNSGTLNNFRGGTLNYFNSGTLNNFNGGTLNTFFGGTLSYFHGGTLNTFWGGMLSYFNGGTLNDFRGGMINSFNSGTLNNFRGGTLNNFIGGTLVRDHRKKVSHESHDAG